MLDEKKELLSLDTHEKCSLLIDGELDEVAIDSLLAQYHTDETIGEQVQTFHLIGDTLRSADFAHSYVKLKKSFGRQEFKARLAKEPLILAPTELPRDKSILNLLSPRWAGLAVASVALIAFVGVVGFSQRDQNTPSLQATFSSPSLNAITTNISPDKSNILQASKSTSSPANYIAAHQQFGSLGTHPGYVQSSGQNTTLNR